MNLVILGLLLLAAMSIGLRLTEFLTRRLHPAGRLAAAILIGGILTLGFLQFCDANRIFEFGLGLLISLSPVGVFDLVKWWFLWGR